MRIISGKYKGRIIHPPKKLRARPTTDKARESLFNILNNHFALDEIKALDLFSGTGSVGFEFASRGANYVEMVEKNFLHYKFIQETQHHLQMENVRVRRDDFFRYIQKADQKFDIIFADPPYQLERFPEVPVLILKKELLNSEGWFILEHSRDYEFTGLTGYFDTRKYGSVNFSFFRAE